MSVIVVGLNHRTVPVEILGRVTVSDQQLPKVLHDLVAREHLLEVVVLSTCNRTEIYANCTHFHAAVGDIREFLATHSSSDPAEFEEHLYTYYDDAAIAHLFSVAADLRLIVLSGDKRALRALCEVEGAADDVSGLIVTLEAALIALHDSIGADALRSRIAALRPFDKTVQICFSDSNADPSSVLWSYYNSLAAEVAPLALWRPPSGTP